MLEMGPGLACDRHALYHWLHPILCAPHNPVTGQDNALEDKLPETLLGYT